MNTKNSIAKGHELNVDTWEDFVERLRHDCEGEGVKDHCTAEAIFIVQAKRYVFGVDTAYTDDKVLIVDDSHWFSLTEYYNDSDDDEAAELNNLSNAIYDCDFMKCSDYEKWRVVEELPGATVTGYSETWEYVSSHFTKDAAEAFVKRKSHDYRDGLRVFVDAQVCCWEYNEIKKAILDGRIKYVSAGA